MYSLITKLKSFTLRIFGIYQGPVKSFTYYIPGPPERKIGYREKEFDMIFADFINRGHKVISQQVVSHQGASSSGVWVFLMVQATNPKYAQLDLNYPDLDLLNSDIDLTSNPHGNKNQSLELEVHE